MKDWTYLEAVENLHEMISDECLRVAESIAAVEAGGDQASEQLKVASEELMRLGTRKARAWTMVQEARLRASGPRLPETRKGEPD